MTDERMTKHNIMEQAASHSLPDDLKASRKKRKREKLKLNLSDEDTEIKTGSEKVLNIINNEIKIVASSATDYASVQKDKDDGVSLLLFYQYVEPPWTPAQHRSAIAWAKETGNRLGLGGRMRIAREGFNCTLTGTYDAARSWCKELRDFCPEFFSSTEFKITDYLPKKQMFTKLHCFSVDELVNYGFTKTSLPPPPLSRVGRHLEPEEYHKKIQEKDTVIIDVRNHYEAAIGHFKPPEGGAELVDPMMRKSTEFPCWLDKPETKEKLRGKQVLMYCTGGVRCERASALLCDKIATDDEMKNLGIKGVFQLQGGIDKYFKMFPDGGYWNGKNYVFDKRYSHCPPLIEANVCDEQQKQPIGKCEACSKPWDQYRGNKRRCPTCGVPSLICRECFTADEEGTKLLDKTVRCELCVEQNITSKHQIKERERQELNEYETKVTRKTRVLESTSNDSPTSVSMNPENITRLYISNLCKNRMNEQELLKALPGVTHVLWLKERNTGKFNGSCLVEMESPDAASNAACNRNGMMVLGRPMRVKFQKANSKDVWPPPSAIKLV